MTDPDARLYRKTFQGEARLAYLGHVLMENRHGLIVDGMATTADGHAECDAALLLLHRHARAGRARTVGADKQYDTHDFVDLTRQLGYTPHVSQNVKGAAAVRLMVAPRDTRATPAASPVARASSASSAG